MQPAIPFSFPKIDEDVGRLKKLLEIGMRVAAWQPPDGLAVLNLACGRADETGVLMDVLSPLSSVDTYLGVDLRDAEIAEARARWLADPARVRELEFRVGDASKIHATGTARTFDFIFIRHQNFWHDPKVWADIYQLTLERLKPSGRLCMTSYFDREHALARACLTQLGAVSAADIPHPASRPLDDAPGKSVDRRLAMFRLPEDH